MIVLCCHPALPRDAQVALSLKTAGGFSVQEIARAFLVTDATIAQRLVRAKRQLRALDVRFELPAGAELASRLEIVLARRAAHDFRMITMRFGLPEVTPR